MAGLAFSAWPSKAWELEKWHTEDLRGSTDTVQITASGAENKVEIICNHAHGYVSSQLFQMDGMDNTKAVGASTDVAGWMIESFDLGGGKFKLECKPVPGGGPVDPKSWTAVGQ